MTRNTRRQHALLAALPKPEIDPWTWTEDHPHPDVGTDEVLIETHYVALNPVDWKGVKYRFGLTPEPKVMGRDGSGIVVAVGDGVTDLAAGDRVWYCSNTALPHSGAFQHFSLHRASQVGKVPPTVSLQSAAAIGTGFLTAAVLVFKCFGFPVSKATVCRGRKTGPWIFITAGASSTGIYLIQLAHRLGLRVITTASKPNHAYLKSLGADVVLKRHDKDHELVHNIRKYTEDGVTLAVDNIGPKHSAVAREILAGSSAWRAEHHIMTSTDETVGRLVSIAGSPKDVPAFPDAVRTVDEIRISFSTTFYGQPEFAREVVNFVYQQLERGLLVPQRVYLDNSGLSGVRAALDTLEAGKVPSGYKLVVGGLQPQPLEAQIFTERASAKARARLDPKRKHYHLDAYDLFEYDDVEFDPAAEDAWPPSRKLAKVVKHAHPAVAAVHSTLA
ncbi:hypothetical protein Q8F55_007309 [Vanrija albida]|uniref:Enoyl reductase (ER) domain-containing protein n=1 Tax=Vanrija albida TaxID=181172 RepID=A0ABR3PZH4_9TREE